jgi:RasGEF N-terminal motif
MTPDLCATSRRYMEAFLLTHNFFVDTYTLMKCIVDRFAALDTLSQDRQHQQPSDGKAAAVKKKGHRHDSQPSTGPTIMQEQLKLINVVKRWIRLCFTRDFQDAKTRDLLHVFLVDLQSREAILNNIGQQILTQVKSAMIQGERYHKNVGSM